MVPKSKKKIKGDFDIRLLIWGWNQLESDFLAHYGIDLYNFIFVKKVSFRRFMGLVVGLPSEGAFFRFVRDKNNYSLPMLLQ